MRRAAALLLVALTACSIGERRGEVTVDDLDRVAEQTSLSARAFTSSVDVDGERIVVEGTVQDDYRYGATVTRDGAPSYEERVIDDARYVRVIDTDAFAGADVTDDAVRALVSGAWVVDPTGAPTEFGAAEPPRDVPLGPRLVLEQVRFPERVPSLLNTGDRVKAYNPDAADHLPQDDRFPAHTADGRRFDMLPKPFDPGVIAVSYDGLRSFFLYASVWVKDGTIRRVEQVFELPDADDPQYRRLFEQIDRGVAGTPVGALGLFAPTVGHGLTVRESYVLRPLPDDAVVEVPADAVEVDLDEALAALASASSGGAGVSLPEGIDVPAVPGLGVR